MGADVIVTGTVARHQALGATMLTFDWRIGAVGTVNELATLQLETDYGRSSIAMQ